MKLKLIKIASILMVLSMVFALAIPAFAEGEATEPTNYTVTLEYGPVSATFTVAEGETLAGVLNNARGAGKGTYDDQFRAFQGWYCGDVEVTEETVVNSDMVVKAVYSFEVIVHVGPNSQTYAVGENETLWILGSVRGVPFVDDEGRDFQGWVDADGNVVTVDTPVTAPMEVYADYSYNVTVNVGSHSDTYPVGKTETLWILDTIKGLPFVDDNGREFQGWVDANGEAVTSATVVTSPMEISPVYSYNVVVHVGPNSVIYPTNGNDTLWILDSIKGVPTIDHDGRDFLGWFYADGSEANATDVVTERTEVYAKYSYSVTLHYGPISESYLVGDNETLWILGSIRQLPFVDDEGREFVGWYCNGDKVTYETPVTSNMDIYAKYMATIHVGDKVLNKKMIDVKYQLSEGDYENTTDIRFVTSIDSLDYKSVSFKVSLDGDVYTLTSHNAYTALSGEDRSPAQAFVADSQYFVAYTITNMPTNMYTEITVQAVLELVDGTTVEGDVLTVAFN